MKPNSDQLEDGEPGFLRNKGVAGSPKWGAKKGPNGAKDRLIEVMIDKETEPRVRAMKSKRGAGIWLLGL